MVYIKCDENTPVKHNVIRRIQAERAINIRGLRVKVLFDRKGRRYLVSGVDDFHTNYGMITSQALMSAKAGDLVVSNKGEKFTVTEPSILDQIAKAKRGPQAMTLKDMGLAIAYSGIRSGSRVLEAGTGSGLFTMYLAHIVHPETVTTYEVREDHAAIAEKNLRKYGIQNVMLKIKDIYGGVEGQGFDAVFLDLAEPWMALEHAGGALRNGGTLVSYSPSINQSRQLAEKLGDMWLHETFECILRHWKPLKMSPDTRMIGHTGFLTIARKLIGGN
jgi:tRNA (adenine57-N1/adenine58-N1)-methyltransferase catalytic subunit